MKPMLLFLPQEFLSLVKCFFFSDNTPKYLNSNETDVQQTKSHVFIPTTQISISLSRSFFADKSYLSPDLALRTKNIYTRSQSQSHSVANALFLDVRTRTCRTLQKVSREPRQQRSSPSRNSSRSERLITFQLFPLAFSPIAHFLEDRSISRANETFTTCPSSAITL